MRKNHVRNLVVAAVVSGLFAILASSGAKASASRSPTGEWHTCWAAFIPYPCFN
jgi:hypothetical protein